MENTVLFGGVEVACLRRLTLKADSGDGSIKRYEFFVNLAIVCSIGIYYFALFTILTKANCPPTLVALIWLFHN